MQVSGENKPVVDVVTKIINFIRARELDDMSVCCTFG